MKKGEFTRARRILCVGYRVWALNIYGRLLEEFKEKDITVINGVVEYENFDIDAYRPDLILFYGWSNIVPANIIRNYTCLMLHPSDLPNYKGGSPLQNQIIDGVIDSKVTIFHMNEVIDGGDILGKMSLSLRGSITAIFRRIEDIGFELTKTILSEGASRVKQNGGSLPYHERRKPAQSEITPDELANRNAEYLYNKIRMLGDPYPNAFIRTKDGKKLVITEAYIDEIDDQ